MNIADMIPSPGKIVLQTFEDGRYVSGLLANRYQIFASKFYDGKFCIFDHETQENIRAKNNEYFALFDSIEAAEQHIGVKAGPVPAPKGKKAVAKPVQRAPKQGRTESPLGYKSPLGYLKELLRTNSELTNEAIAGMVQSMYPDCKYNHSMVKYNRKKMYGG